MAPYTLPDPLLESLLQDDTPCGDATTQALAIGGQPGRMIFRARAEMLCGADILQQQMLVPDVLRRIKRSLSPTGRTRIAAAGGINSANAEHYARAGADILVTSAPYFAPPRDVAVTLIAV